MTMRRFAIKYLYAALLLAALGASCTNEVRYTSKEIEGYPPEIKERIQRGEVDFLMTFDQVRYSWGAPSDIKMLPPADSGKERIQWIYKKHGVFTSTLTFEDGKLVEISSNEPYLKRK
jgi:hypothetical protein